MKKAIFLFTAILALATGCENVDREVGECNPHEGEAGMVYLDSDRDGFGDPNQEYPEGECPEGLQCVDNALDCDDTNRNINPDADEVCDGIDNDCDGRVDEGLDCEGGGGDTTTWYEDADGDGFGNVEVSTEVEEGEDPPAGYVSDDTDCDDTDFGINAEANEICDGIDNDCDGDIDADDSEIDTCDEEDCPDCQTWYIDTDGDGTGAEWGLLVAETQPEGYVAGPDDGGYDFDCDDNDEYRSPRNLEICDWRDNDCDGSALVDETADGDVCVQLCDEDGDGTEHFELDGDSALECVSGFTANDSQTGGLYSETDWVWDDGTSDITIEGIYFAVASDTVEVQGDPTMWEWTLEDIFPHLAD